MQSLGMNLSKIAFSAKTKQSSPKKQNEPAKSLDSGSKSEKIEKHKIPMYGVQKDESAAREKMAKAEEMLDDGIKHRSCRTLVHAQQRLGTVSMMAEKPGTKAKANELYGDAGVVLHQPGAKRNYEYAAKLYEKAGMKEEAADVNKKIKHTPRKLRVWP